MTKRLILALAFTGLMAGTVEAGKWQQRTTNSAVGSETTRHYRGKKGWHHSTTLRLPSGSGKSTRVRINSRGITFKDLGFRVAKDKSGKFIAMDVKSAKPIEVTAKQVKAAEKALDKAMTASLFAQPVKGDQRVRNLPTKSESTNLQHKMLGNVLTILKAATYPAVGRSAELSSIADAGATTAYRKLTERLFTTEGRVLVQMPQSPQ